jgi:hypothetical protein
MSPATDAVARQAAIERDAERYGWICAKCISEDETFSPSDLIEDCWALAGVNTKAKFDARIDRAMRADP